MKRDWTVLADDRNAVLAAFDEIETIGHHIGGTFVIGTVRVPRPKETESSPDEYDTAAWRIHYDSFVPSAKFVEADEPAGDAADEEPDEDVDPEIPKAA